MKQILILTTCSLLILFPAAAQVTDDFTDGDFLNNPSWQGDTDEFVVDAASELQLFAPDAGTSQLYLPVSLPDNTVWEMYFRLEFAPSNANRLRIVLQASDTDLNTSPGYFLQIGEDGSNDAIQLYRRDNAASATLLASAVTGGVAGDPALAGIKVLRSPTGAWQLYTDYANSGTFALEASANDNTYPAGSGYFGFYCIYTATRKDKFFFDDIALTGMNVADLEPPVFMSVNVISATQLDVLFNEPLTLLSANTEAHYFIDNSINNPASAVQDGVNPALVHLTLGTPLTNGQSYAITTNGLSDLAGNMSGDQQLPFSFFDVQPAVPFDILINEIMADPDPVVALPNAEYIELFNRSNKAIQLEGYTFTDGATVGTFPEYVLAPGAYVIVCDDAYAGLFAPLGDVIALTSFPSLNNTGDMLLLSDAGSIPIHAVSYTLDWYQDDLKNDGGWSLELIYPNRPCSTNDSNWIASASAAGGTPGSPNSVLDESPDTEPFNLVSVEVVDQTTIIVYFNKSYNAFTALQSGNYSIDQGIGMPSTVTPNPDLQSVTLSLLNPLTGNGFFTLTTTGLTDCAGNALSGSASFSFTLPEPEILEADAVSETGLDVYFNEPLNPATILTANFNVSNGIDNPATATLDGADPALVHLTFSTSFQNGVTYILTVNNVENLAETAITDGTISFFYYVAALVEPYDIIINEVFPDPTPSLGLPEVEYVELFNRSNKVLNLDGMLLSSGPTTTSVLPPFLLLPGHYVVIYKATEGISFTGTADTIALVNFISLSNEGDEVSLSTATGEIIDVINYDLSWYHNPSKQDGGWSLERINPSTPCTGSDNWVASENFSGGTPGQPNSVLSDDPDTGAPLLISAFPLTSTAVEVHFNEALQSASATGTSNYQIEPGIGIQSVDFQLSDPGTVILTLASPLQENTTYTLSVLNPLSDCLGNSINVPQTLLLALPQPIAAGDLLINEILFDPATGGYRFLELFNHSNKVVNVQDLNIASIDDNATQVSPVTSPFLVFPGEYVVFSERPDDIISRYTTPNPGYVIKNDLPTFDSDTGNVTIYTKYLPTPVTVDVFNYSKSYHNPLLSDKEGVSLERLSPIIPTQSAANWHSAASAVGYATPTYLNSQNIGDSLAQEDFINFDPEVFSPDDDGFDDVLVLNYILEKPGFLAQVHIFDARGRLIKTLSNNELLGTTGLITWKGETDNGEKAPIGIYIVLAELIHPDGDVKSAKKTCVLAGKL